MSKKIVSIILLIFLPFSLLVTPPVFAGAQAVEYLCELGISFYRLGKYEDALMEFERALLVDPNNQKVKSYINKIFLQETVKLKPKRAVAQQPSPPPSQKPQKMPTKEEAIKNAFDELSKKEAFQEKVEKGKAKYQFGGLNVTGEVQLRGGGDDRRDALWQRANWDLNEKNWRMISSNGLNRRENTYDTRIYDRLRVDLDTDNKEGFNFHSNIMFDPWSYVGKSEAVTLIGAGGDVAKLELKYWGNTGYTINETIKTIENGDSFALPEIKVPRDSDHISIPIQITSAFNNIFTLPEIKIERWFQPVREFWFDYKQDGIKFRFFPIAYENQAVTFDDPLKLSNNHIWWEDSPWIRGWRQGIYNLGASPVDFTKGYWDKELSFSIRDSEGRRLTALRGGTFEFNPGEGTYFVTSVASPRNPWQDYGEADNVLSATRFKQSFTDNITLGLTGTTRVGYNVKNKDKVDAWNYLGGADLSIEPVDGLMTTFEVAHSNAKYDLTYPDYKTEARGFAYQFSLLGRFPFQPIIDTAHGYDGIQPAKDERFFTKFRFFAARMDESFDTPLSSYVETRDDEFWARHLHFRQPFKYYYQGEGQTLTWDDIKNYRIGNGIDIGRSVFGFRLESLLWDKKVDNLFDVRNVHATNGKFVENVAREEITWGLTDKLTTKLLGIYHRLPQTKGNIDPYIFDTTTRLYFDNTYIDDHKSASVSVGSLGMEYTFFDWLALNGIWEYTNDLSLGYDNFPRGILNSGNRSYTYYEYDKKYRVERSWLYSQRYFPKPPYPYYNVFKAGLRYDPIKNLELYLDYTRNPYEKAGQVDDNMNHIGFEALYTPLKKLSIFLKYAYSRWQDLDSLTQGFTKVWGHHNAFAEFIYRLSDDEDFTLQYGEASRDPYMGGVLTIGWDPYGGSLRTIDTQHICRLYYRRKF